jgi:hypothetical protein
MIRAVERPKSYFRGSHVQFTVPSDIRRAGSQAKWMSRNGCWDRVGQPFQAAVRQEGMTYEVHTRANRSFTHYSGKLYAIGESVQYRVG